MDHPTITGFIGHNKWLRLVRGKKVFGFIFVMGPFLTIILLLLINLKKPWEFDESYNLQIVQNLRSGHGYATNGAFRGSGPYLFDPYISTGPAVLIPIYVVASIVRNTQLAARLVMLAYFLCLLGLFYHLTPRSNYGRFTFGLTLAAILPVVVATNPLFVLGELPATFFLLLATVAMRQRMPTLTGVALAAVVLCKLNFALATVAFLILVVIRIAFDQRNGTKFFFYKTWRLICGFSYPILVFEMYRLISLGGLTAYRTNIRELRNFIDSQRLDHWSSSAEFLGTKLTSIINIPGIYLWTTIIVCLVALSMAVISNQKISESQTAEDEKTFAPALVSGLTILGTFLFLSSAPFERQAASFFYLVFPLTILLTLNRMKTLVLASSRRVRTVGVLTILMVAVPLGLGTLTTFGESVQTIRASNFGIAFADQRAASKVIRESGATSIILDGWFQNPEYQLLSGVPAASMPGSGGKPIIVRSVIKNYFSGTNDFLRQKEICREVLYASENVFVCWPKNTQ